MTTEPKKYFVRFSNADDHDKIIAFYDTNAHKNVRKRQEDLLKKLADDGAIVLVEDKSGTIVGTSISYAHTGKDANGIEVVKWQEVGSTRMVLNGFSGLFDTMIGLQVLKTFLVEPPEDRFVCQMHTEAL